MYKVKRIFTYLKVLLLTLAAKAAGVFAKRKKEYKELWIVSERGSEARDNGYHFFRYLTKEHPEVNSVYIITKNSPDRDKVKALGKVVDYGSLKHYLCYTLAKVRISTHIDGYSPDILFFYKFGKLFKDKAKDVFLQHGIIQSDMAFCHADRTRLDLFICSAKPEFDYIDKMYGYKKGVLKLTGMCRFDNLRKSEKPTKKILFMPTWRSSLRTCGKSAFTDSEYFKKYNGFLNSKELISLLEEYDYELIFYPHFEVQRFLDCFETSSGRIKTAGFKTSDVQDLLINSDILVTDYSSVFFDFSYMRKPVVYFQYDEAAFRAEQYGDGYFDYERDGFGKIAATASEVVTELSRIIKNGLKPDDIYLERLDSFYAFSDTNNCKRNYDAICELFK